MTSIGEKEKIREEKYQPFRDQLDLVETGIINQPPERWWWASMFFLRRLKRKSDGLPAEAQTFVGQYEPLVADILGREIGIKRRQIPIPVRAVQVMHDLSDALAANEKNEYENRSIHRITMSELVKLSSRFRLTTRADKNNQSRDWFGIYSEDKKEWFDYPIPRTKKVLHKGGFGRTILKILAGAPNVLVEAELPPHDFDYLIIDDGEGRRDAGELAADPDGIETVHNFDFQGLMASRDITLNGAFVGREGMVFSDEAFESARSGKIAILAAKRGLYGSEIFFGDGVVLLKNRGMMRLLKTVAEGKAMSFDFLPVNRQIELGIYWLVLTKRFSHQPNFPIVMDRLLALAGQIGQVPAGTRNIYEVLDRVHTKYPFFDFDAEPQNELSVARWLGRKLVKQIDKKYRDESEIPSLIVLERRPGDTVPYEVNLKGYMPDPKVLALTPDQWSRFLIRSRRRMVEYVENVGGETESEKED